MLQGMYAAATGMVTLEMRQEVIANNLSNASTPGYKRHAPVQFGFYDVFTSVMRRPAYFGRDTAPGGGVKMLETYPNGSAGPIVATSNPLNVALEGPGYLVANTPRGERFTRNGSFSIDADGDLATNEGHKLQSVAGQALAVNDGVLVVGGDGTVTVDGAVVGQLRMVEFGEPHRLLREGDNLLAASAEVMEGQLPAENTQLNPESLEMSNVNVSGEMINMMLGMRAYEANQRVVQAFDQTLSRLIEQVATA